MPATWNALGTEPMLLALPCSPARCTDTSPSRVPDENPKIPDYFKNNQGCGMQPQTTICNLNGQDMRG